MPLSIDVVESPKMSSTQYLSELAPAARPNQRVSSRRKEVEVARPIQ
jgi:hypothetical protein